MGDYAGTVAAARNTRGVLIGCLSVSVVSTPEEIEEFAQRTCIGFINFSVLALPAGNCSKFFVLEI